MTDAAPDTIVMAVADGVVGPASAYVSADVRRRGGRVRVAHVVPALDIVGLPEPMVIEGETLRRAGADVLDRAVSTVEHLLPDTLVLPALLHGRTVPELIKVAQGARRIVLQRRAQGRRRVMTLSTSTGVAARARVPVVVVPGDWTPDPQADETVVVGVHDVLTSPDLLETAFDEASMRGARLRIVHAWHFSDQYDDLVFAGSAGHAYEEELRRDHTRELHQTFKRHPDTAVDLVVEHAHAGDLLTAESARAGLLVLGRHRASSGWGPHLGSVVRAVLREAACPVLVVDAARDPEPHREKVPEP